MAALPSVRTTRQELIPKLAELPPELPRPAVHFIGQLQSNKVRSLAPIVDVWQTVDRDSLVSEIARRAPAAVGFGAGEHHSRGGEGRLFA